MAGRSHGTMVMVVRAAVSVGLITAGVGVFSLLVWTKPVVKSRPPEELVRTVEAMTLRRVPVRRTWQGFGTARVVESVDLSAEVAGIVAEVSGGKRAGDAAAAGETIIRLVDDDYRFQEEVAAQSIARLEAQRAALSIEEETWRTQLALAEEETRIAREEYETAKEVLGRDAGNEMEVDRRLRGLNEVMRTESRIRDEYARVRPRRDELMAALALEEARLGMARLNVARCEIRSPLAGVLQAVDVEKGERVAIGERLARVVDPTRLEVPVQFPVSARAWVKVGDTAKLTAQGPTAWCWVGRLSRFAPESDPASRTFTAFAIVDAETGAMEGAPALVPGQFVEATLETAEAEDRLVVPRRAVLNESVLLIRDGQVAREAIAVERYESGVFPAVSEADREWVVVGEPTAIAEGEAVILSNVDELKPGARVKAAVAGGE